MVNVTVCGWLHVAFATGMYVKVLPGILYTNFKISDFLRIHHG